MKIVVDFLNWMRSKFFLITFVIFFFLYVWWFRLNPITFGLGEEATAPFIFGLFLLSIYGLIIGTMNLSNHHSFLKPLSFVMAILFLVVNVGFVKVYLPGIVASAHFGNDTYYITSNFPFLECCGYHQFTKWQGIFHYESRFFGYYVPPVKFIYDKKMNEVSLINISGDSEKLYKTLGKSPRSYDGYAQLGNHLYYGSLKRFPTDEEFDWTYHFSLYQCELDNTSCVKLPMEYISKYDGYIELYANKMTEEVYFFRQPVSYKLPKELIYIYGKHSRCYVEGCTIFDK